MIRTLCIIVSCFHLLFLTRYAESSRLWNQTINYKINKYALSARWALAPYFAKARINYPPQQLAFLVFKQSKRLEVYAKGRGRWHYIRTYPVYAASGGYGPKLESGDKQVPEGIYQIIDLNPYSHFDLSMELNYPNLYDREFATFDHRRHLGDNIYIHGRRRSIGCIAIGNEAIQQLFPLVYRVGLGHVTVIIAPDDLRIKKPVYGRIHPWWLQILYEKITRALKTFPEPRFTV